MTSNEPSGESCITPPSARAETTGGNFANTLSPDLAAEMVRRWNCHNVLLAACEAAVQRANESRSGTAGLVDTIHAMHSILRAAIAKAEGTASERTGRTSA